MIKKILLLSIITLTFSNCAMLKKAYAYPAEVISSIKNRYFKKVELNLLERDNPLSKGDSDLIHDQKPWWKESYYIAQSAATFHLSMWYNRWRFGSAFSFHEIVKRNDGSLKAAVEINNTEITQITDDKKAPILLGSIPRLPEQLLVIRSNSKKMGLYTLNRNFECNWAGLTQIRAQPGMLNHFYPTTDHCAPRFLDLLRAVHDLETRDEREEEVAYVHCKAGRGRSAVTVAAYLLHVCNKAGRTDITQKQVEAYIMHIRPRVCLNNEHREILGKFHTALKKEGTLQSLYSKFKSAILAREQELATAA